MYYFHLQGKSTLMREIVGFTKILVPKSQNVRRRISGQGNEHSDTVFPRLLFLDSELQILVSRTFCGTRDTGILIFTGMQFSCFY